jgi:hypothetical protein
MLAIWFEIPHPRRTLNTDCELVPDEDSEMSAKAYGERVAGGYRDRDLRSLRVTTIALRGDTGPASVLNNVCEQRWYVAKLIERLGDEAVAEIVMDKYFSPRSCSVNDPGTLALVSAVRAFRGPIVAAAATHAAESDPKKACLILSPSLDFGKKPNSIDGKSNKPAVYTGISRLNADVRKIPLFWYVYKSDESFTNHEDPSDVFMDTLPYAAAILVDARLGQDKRLKVVRANVEPDSLAHLDALDFLCSGPSRMEIESRYSVTCGLRKQVDPSSVGGQVVVIGEDAPGKDRHLLFGRDVPGMYLQANYIESLLVGHYLRPLGDVWNMVTLVVWVTLLYLLFWRLQPELALLVCVAIAAFAWYGLKQLVAWNGFYLDAWPRHLGVIALALKYIEVRGHATVEAIRKSRSRREASRVG